MHRYAILFLVLITLVARPAGAAPAPRLATLPIPGDAAWVAQARDILDVLFTLDPSLASGAGLFDDADRVPSYGPAAVRTLSSRLRSAMDALRKIPWRSWDVDTQIDVRWVFACAELAQRQLDVERLYVHRPACWLEPAANNMIALVTYAPKRLDLQAAVLRRVPGMVTEMRQVCTSPTIRDVEIAKGVLRGLIAMCESKIDPALRAEQASAAAALDEARQIAAKALRAYEADLKPTAVDAVMIGRENYAWRLKHMLLPWTPDTLLALAESERRRVEGEMAALQPQVKAVVPTEGERQALDRMAHDVTRDRLLGLYNDIPVIDRIEIERHDLMTIPAGVGPIYARETPDAMVPLTGDGGSMNPPPTYCDSNVGYWNVEHFHADWSLARRLEAVTDAVDFRTNGMGPYAVHEGVPGHHLQLSIARLNPDPIRSILPDPVQNEGWALYAEEAFWRAGGMGPSAAAHYNTLRSYMYRIKRVIYDVHLECGEWTLRQAADFKYGAGKGSIDPDILRSINWPAQLICYFAGKSQIMQLREDYRKRMGAEYSERKFHDALLALGSVPVVFARCKLLGEPVPDL